MTRTGEARGDILRAIREHLAASAPHDALARGGAHATHAGGRAGIALPIVTGGSSAPLPLTGAALAPLARFSDRLEAVGGRCVVVRGEAEAARALGGILSEAGARRVAGSDAPLVGRLLQQAGGGFAVESIGGLSREGLLACDVGVTTAQWGIAETGTLVLESAHERSRLLSLVPPVHVALLSAGDICDSLGEALARAGATDASGMLASHAITLVTGPSRTSDIELTLTIGVHGPQALHVIVLEEEA